MNWHPVFTELINNSHVYLSGPRWRRILEGVHSLWGVGAVVIVVAVLAGLRIWQEISDHKFNERERNKKK